MSAERCKQILSELMEYSCSPEFASQMQVAREVFEMATGKVNDDDNFYDGRMLAFQEFFIFDYRLSDVFPGSTVFENFLLNAQTQMDANVVYDYEQLRSLRHSLFVVEKGRSESVLVRDLIARTKFEVFPLPDFVLAIFDTVQVFEARIFNFNDRHYFTGAFVFHPKEVRDFIEDFVGEFLTQQTHSNAEQLTDWRSELQRRHELLAVFAEQRRKVEQASKKRAIDLLNVTKHLTPTAYVASSPNLVMALGRNENVSPFVPETPFYSTMPLLQRLAYYEIRTHRYRHIDPLKIYSVENITVFNVRIRENEIVNFADAKPQGHTG